MEITRPRSSSYYSYAQENKAESSPEGRASSAERDSRRRVAEAEKQVEDAARFAQLQEEKIKNDHDAAVFNESQHHEERMQAQIEKHRQILRQLQEEQHTELSRLRRIAEEELAKVKEFYSKNIYDTEKYSKEKLNELQWRNTLNMEHERRSALDESSGQTQKHEIQLKRLQENNETRYSNELKASSDRYEQLKTASNLALEQANEHFQEKFNHTLAEQDKTLDHLRGNASQKLTEIREETAQKLNAYRSRQNDPFYKLVRFDAKIQEEPDQYIVSARVPQHEQDKINISLKGNTLVITGNRRNEERLEVAPGHTQSTSSFQSFQESFPLALPVSAKEITRRFDGDQLIVTVPKLKRDVYQAYQAQAKKDSEGKLIKRIRAEAPQFPENLPKTEKSESSKKSENPSTSGSKSPGSRTLG